MNLKSLSFITTEDCNFNCSYCRQEKEKRYLAKETVTRAVDFFYPYLLDGSYIFFYGGEPLLAFDIIEHAVSCFKKNGGQDQKELQYSVSTNGALLDEKKLEFFQENRFELLVSYDGLAQDRSRKPGTSGRTLDILEKIKGYPGITLYINSVYSPDTVNQLSRSIKHIVESGHTRVRLGLCLDCPWDDTTLDTLESELEKLSQYLLDYRSKTGIIPVTNFTRPPQERKDGAVCSAGHSMLSLSPRETVWGCHVFHAYFKNKPDDPDYSTYSFGTLSQFMENPEEMYRKGNSGLKALRQDNYYTSRTPCFACDHVSDCNSCPVSAAYVTSFIGELPDWHCRFHHIYNSAKSKFSRLIAS